MAEMFASPAKVNLFLRVIGRRSDGFHEIVTLMQAVDLCDTLSFAFSDSDHLICNDPTLPTNSRNLVLQAVALFRQKSGKKFQVTVTLDKRIPTGAGLGGGSSNAATTLWALNRLCGSPATDDELAEWSAVLGSDIPFFFSPGTALCRGRGEIVEPLSPLPEAASLALAIPDIHCVTPVVYRALQLQQLEPRCSAAALESWQLGTPQRFNDLEAAALNAYPALAEPLQQARQAGYESVQLSGSGASFMCWGAGDLSAARPVRFLRRHFGSWYT